MDYKSIELQILQLEESFSKSRSNIYSDPKKQTHFDELHILFKAIKKSDYKHFDLLNLQNHFFLLNYIFKGLEYLDNSTLNIIPYEIISCLEYALEDWIDKNKFIIATSLSNKNLDFYFESTDSNEEFNNINILIDGLYCHKLTHRLIKISLPKVLSRDYLSCVVLYHELGHFVDMELNISKKIFLKNYHKTDPTNYDEYRFLCHKREYFADLFAAQYINDASNLFLNYIAFDNPDCETHPATNKRISVVENFLKGRICSELNEFNSVLSVSGPTELKIRYKKLDINKSDFLKLIPQNIKNVDELHYIFKLGWDFWNTSESNFLKNFESRQKYHIINNLIEKSISNYTITEKWQEIL
ncbi:hypothetical protein [Flavobacterium salmonis]|uniref:Uncharacterized protein n=1 Tax=Flavobacterium salmonis TaxID=2654844 RepID=A0A6V6YQI5_9FLAO|nr:hypothetical protein [Flavobacterium salmonis]CAD0001683.1 hypothetical protein FLAT13_00747 [Flavobacterium salmonis]